MASLIPGYEYDIFISYRQKDNKGDKWVSEFVEALKTELESTFKDEISVYFDINPHDGLLETHVVDASLKEKLKCLIFIPVISQTYCDPKSFAWQHEFVAFNTMAKEDQFGRDIRLLGGNVASRILPVKIHDLDPEDKELLENELGSVLRGIEFIYREAGVNRPLKPNDDPKENLNRTNYRNQVNKVANAVKEIITAIRKFEQKDDEKLVKVVGIKPTPHGNLRQKIIIASAVILALVVLGFFLIPRLIGSSRQVEKSIAVLPFINDSPDQGNTYFINGLMEEVLNNLQKIKDFRVLSRTSTEQYRGTTRPTIPEIAKKLDVNYIVEGSGQKYGKTFRLRVQLIAAGRESHLWAESFEQEISETKDIFRIQTQISQNIAAALKATITPEEKQLIEKTPTANLTAYDFYNRGNEELTKYYYYDSNRTTAQKAKYFFNKALEYDSTFARAYTGLAEVYSIQYFSINESYYSKNWLDSILVLADLALSYDDHLPEAYSDRGFYYWQNGKIEQAITEYNKVLKYSPNNSHAYKILGRALYVMDYNYADWVKALEYCHKAVSLEHGAELPLLLRNLGEVYGFAGFPDKQKYYYNEAFKLDGDSNQYYNDLAGRELNSHDYKKAIQLYNKCYAKDSTNIWIVSQIANAYCKYGQYNESLKYIKKVEGMLESSVSYSAMKEIGYIYWLNGYKKEAKEWFDKQKKLSEESLKLGRIYSADANYDLAAVYAFTGEREKAYENLRIVSKIRVCPAYLLGGIKDDPLFNSIRNEPEFKQIVSDLELKYQTEHERVRKWMEEQGKLLQQAHSSSVTSGKRMNK